MNYWMENSIIDPIHDDRHDISCRNFIWSDTNLLSE